MRLKDLDEDDERTKIRADGKQDAVRILTIHASKGLEYPIVFAIGVAARPTNPEYYNQPMAKWSWRKFIQKPLKPI